jgi:hypothetical protein
VNLLNKILGGLLKELRPTPSPFSPPSNDPNVAIIAEPKVSYIKLALIILALAGWGWKVYAAIKADQPIPPVPDLNFKANDPEPSEYGTGWVNDPVAVTKALADGKTPLFATTPAGKASLGDVEAFHWRAVRKAAGRGEDWYPNVNQKSVGCCVGCGFKHGVDALQGVQIAIMGLPLEWKPVSVEAIYAASRVEVGGGRINGDGSLGVWAKQAVEQEGLLAMQKYDGGFDLSVFDPLRARSWGRSGVPDALEPIAKNNLVKKSSVVRNFAEVKKAIQQGYPVPVCSNVGFNDPDGRTPGTRDKDGFCKPRGIWPHCMVFIGYRSGPKEGIFCLNSWGDEAHKGPAWPADAPRAGFWVDPDTVTRMASQGEAYALSAVDGFPAHEDIDWFGLANPAAKEVAHATVRNLKPIRRADGLLAALAW